MYMLDYSSMTKEQLLEQIKIQLRYKRSEKGRIAQRRAVAKYYKKNKEKVLAKQRETYAKKKLALKTKIVSAH